jgi:type II secretory pathway pseudopilin PulG
MLFGKFLARLKTFGSASTDTDASDFRLLEERHEEESEGVPRGDDVNTHRPNERGFSPVELMVVIEIIAIVGGLAVPKLQNLRRTANAAAAVETVGLLSRAENEYKLTVGKDFFGTIGDLFVNDLIDPVTAGDAGVPPGTRSNFGQIVPLSQGLKGYQFAMTAGPAVDSFPPGGHFIFFTTTAEPDALGRTGNRSFFLDATGVIHVSCTPPKHFDSTTGRCEPEGEFTDAAVVSAILAVNQLSDGTALGAALATPLSPARIQRILRLIDTDNDGLITFREVLDADVVGMARTLSPDATSEIDDNHRALLDLQNRLSSELRRQLVLFLDDGQRFAVPIDGMSGDANRLLRLAEIFASARVNPIP